MHIEEASKLIVEILLKYGSIAADQAQSTNEDLLEKCKAHSISASELNRVYGDLIARGVKPDNHLQVIDAVKKDRAALKDAITETYKAWVNQYPGHIGNDGQKIATQILGWISELSTNAVTAKEFLEIKETLAKDAQFVSRPPSIQDFLNIKKRNSIFDNYSTSNSGSEVVEATKRLSKTFDFRYSNRWSKPDIGEANERLEAWIKHFMLFGITGEAIDKASELAAKMSDFNKFPPSLQDFTLVCKMAICGEDIPGPQEAFLIASGLVRNKTSHPLVTYAASQVGEYELRNGKINKDAFISVYQDAILEYAASGEIPRSSQRIEIVDTPDESGVMDKVKLVNLIDNLLEESENEQYY